MAVRCDLYGHDYHLWKEGRKSYMKCEYCPAVRYVEALDLAWNRPRPLSAEERQKWIFDKWDDLLRRLAKGPQG